MITRKEIEHVANLAKLNLTDEEIEKLTPQMGDIVDFANRISELNTEGVKPTNHILEIKNVFREDEVVPSYKREDIIRNAPAKEAGCIIVPSTVG